MGVTSLAGFRWAPLRRLEISFSQGAEWKALISIYIGTILVSGDPRQAEQSIFIGLPPRTPVISAMIAKVGVAARHSQFRYAERGRGALVTTARTAS